MRSSIEVDHDMVRVLRDLFVLDRYTITDAVADLTDYNTFPGRVRVGADSRWGRMMATKAELLGNGIPMTWADQMADRVFYGEQ